jgi:epoxyqueuosine reductase
MADLTKLKQKIKTEAERLGFNHMGIAPALPVPHYLAYLDWVQSGCHADMDYLSREDTVAKRGDPRLILEGCQRIICLAMPYHRPQTGVVPAPKGEGRISAYAVTQDYHQVIWKKLSLLEAFIQSETKQSVGLKSYTDTGPILERSFAQMAGIGTAGKNSCLLIQGTGSYFFLAEILTDLRLPVDLPYTRDLCGTCRRCIDACPTGCILPDRTIDANRCISYLTIENKGEIPDDLKPQLGDWVFGCDICQIVCPHNAWTPPQTLELGEQIVPEYIALIDLFSVSEAEFIAKFGKTPLSRAKHRGLLRNAAIVLGIQKFSAALPTLKAALEKEEDTIVQDACRWAIQQIELAKRDPTE